MLCKKVSCKVAQKIAYVSVLIKISSVNKKIHGDHPPRRGREEKVKKGGRKALPHYARFAGSKGNVGNIIFTS